MERLEPLISAQVLKTRIRELGETISNDYEDSDLILVGILKGSFIFMADLVREVSIPITLDFMALSSYGASTRSSGIVRILKDLDQSIEERHVLVVEDIVDTGLTLDYIRGHLRSLGAKSVKVCSLLNKSDGRKVDVMVEYIGFHIPNEFVVGYGLDVDERYRNLPDVCRLIRG